MKRIVLPLLFVCLLVSTSQAQEPTGEFVELGPFTSWGSGTSSPEAWFEALNRMNQMAEDMVAALYPQPGVNYFIQDETPTFTVERTKIVCNIKFWVIVWVPDP